MMDYTPLQRQIERTVTSGRGYDSYNTRDIPYDLRNTEIGVQIALFNMGTVDGRQGMDDIYKIMVFTPRVEAMVCKFENAHIPLSTITDADGFKQAFDAAYSGTIMESVVG